MCGIVGVLRFGENPIVPSYNTSALYLATNLLESSETRGGDATGVTALFDNGNFFIQKMGIGAAEFVTRSGGKPDDYEGLMAILRGYSQANMRCFLGHCRKKSVGGLNNVDNHPIKAGNIVGVHNGTLKNDAEIFKNLECERDGKVDSEAIFRLLQHFTKDCTTPFTTEAVVESCVRLEGTYSFLAYNANNPFQVVSARDGRPVEYCLIRPLGLVLVASETKFLDKALWSYNKMARNFPTGNPETAFVALIKDDVEYGTIPNDTAAIFDLTKEISPETKLADLYVKDKVPFQVKPNWKSAVTKVYNNTSYGNGAGYNHHSADKTNNYGNGFSGGADTGTGEKKSTTSTSGAGTTSKGGTNKKDKDDTSPVGKVWDSKLESFVTVFGKREIVEHGTVTDVESGENNKLRDAVTAGTLDAVDADDAKKTTEATSGVAGGVLTPGPKLTSVDEKIEEYDVGEKVPLVRVKPPKASDKQSAVNDIKKGISKVTEAVTGPKRATEASIEAAKGLEKFVDDDELATFIGIDTPSLAQLPPHSLANRITKYLFAKFFVAGWEACCKELNDSSGEKLSKAMKHIRVLKHLTTSLDDIMEIFNDEVINEAAIAPSARLTAAALKSQHDEMSLATLNEIFSSGDYRKSKVLKSIVSNIE